MADKLTFRTNTHGHNHGQTDATLIATLNGEDVGIIDFSNYQDEIHVKWITVAPAARYTKDQKQSVAAALAHRLQQEFPEAEIQWGMTTDDGTKFLNHLTFDEHPTPGYQALATRLDKLQRLEKRLQAITDRLETSTDPARFEAFRTLGDRWNRVNDAIWKVENELRDLKPSKRIIRKIDEVDHLDQEEFDPKNIKDIIEYLESKSHREQEWLTSRISLLIVHEEDIYIYWDDSKTIPLAYAKTRSMNYLGVSGVVVSAVATDPSYRNQGIATILYLYLLKQFNAIWADFLWTPSGLALWTALSRSKKADVYQIDMLDKLPVKVDLASLSKPEIFSQKTTFLMVNPGALPKLKAKAA